MISILNQCTEQLVQLEQGHEVLNLRVDADIRLGNPVPIPKSLDHGLGASEGMWEPSRDAENWVQKTFLRFRGQGENRADGATGRNRLM